MLRIFGPKGHLIVRSATLARVRKIAAALRRRFGRIRIVNLAPAKPFTMYDSIDIAALPSDAAAVAGYVNGHWPTFPGLAVPHPHAKRLSIAVTAHADAQCLDIEQGDATIDEAAAWVRRQHARGVKKPAVYTFLAQAQQLVDALAAAGIKRGQYRLWIAHWSFTPHICSPACGFGLRTNADATQWTNQALGRNLDASLCKPHFLP